MTDMRSCFFAVKTSLENNNSSGKLLSMACKIPEQWTKSQKFMEATVELQVK